MNDPGATPALPDEEPLTASALGPAAEGEPPRGLRRHATRLSDWLAHWRSRIAHAMLLPELSAMTAHDLRRTVHDEARLTNGYVLMCALSAGIATLGLLQSSSAVVIGAMLISPLMAPIAALGFGFASVDGHNIRDAARVVVVGALVGILTGALITIASPIRNATPEILARTQPTLLDLAIALLSGVAGGYATVIGKGGTAIGVAIATALMPPLATLGYGIGVLEWRFAAGALLLFLTNLAAIAFAFATVARLSGAARPFGRVEWTPGYIAAMVAAFLALATPLSLTLLRIAHEASMRSAAQSVILSVSGRNARIAQLDVAWPLFGTPKVDALVVSAQYAEHGAADAEARLSRMTHERVELNLQQVLAADLPAQTQAIVDAAMDRTRAGIAADVPPYGRIRGSIGLPTLAAWTNHAERLVFVEPVPAPGWTLADYRAIENRVNAPEDTWTVRIVPPAQGSIAVALGAADNGAPDAAAVAPDLAIWALQRWGMTRVTLTTADPDEGQGDPAGPLVRALAMNGIKVARRQTPGDAGAEGQAKGTALIGIFAPRPTVLAAEAAARAAAEAAAEASASATAVP